MSACVAVTVQTFDAVVALTDRGVWQLEDVFNRLTTFEGVAVVGAGNSCAVVVCESVVSGSC